MPDFLGVEVAQQGSWHDGLSAPRFASNDGRALDVPIALELRDLHGGVASAARGGEKATSFTTRYARFWGFPRFPDVNATTANPTLAAVTAAAESSSANSFWFGFARCAHVARFLGWGIVGLISAFASYAFGIGALVFGFLGYLRLEAQWWPAVMCLVLGYFCARGAIASLDLAIARAPHRKLRTHGISDAGTD